MDPAGCAVLVQARSTVGAVRFGTQDITGSIELARRLDHVAVDESPCVQLEVPLASLTSGNALYDAELQQRLVVRRFPTARIQLLDAEWLHGDDYRASGRVTIHGVTTTLYGDISVRYEDNGEVVVTGEHVVDIRAFDIDLPSVLMLRIYPDVKVTLRLRARPSHAENHG